MAGVWPGRKVPWPPLIHRQITRLLVEMKAGSVRKTMWASDLVTIRGSLTRAELVRVCVFPTELALLPVNICVWVSSLASTHAAISVSK